MNVLCCLLAALTIYFFSEIRTYPLSFTVNSNPLDIFDVNVSRETISTIFCKHSCETHNR